MYKTPFVIKPTHAAGLIQFVNESDIVESEQISKTANKWMLLDYSTVNREKHYRNIFPRLLIEPQLGAGGVLDDYKVNMFLSSDGSIRYLYIQHIVGRRSQMKQRLYDQDWTPLDFNRAGYPVYDKPTPCPPFLDEMIGVAHQLTK